MCFGPVASFTSGAILTAAGAATLKTASARSKKALLFAAFPLIFGVQQIIEGLIWLGVDNGPLVNYRKPLAAVYLFFAYLVWPIISPVAVYLLETQKTNKRILSVAILMGFSAAIYLLWFVFTYDFKVEIIRHSIQYHVQKFTPLIGVLYMGSTYASYLCSSHRGIKILGAVNIIFAVIARAYYRKTFDSVWCFFAAILSLGIFFFLRSLNEKETKTLTS